MNAFSKKRHSLLFCLAGLAGLHAEGDALRHNHDDSVQLEKLLVSASPFSRDQIDIAQATTVLGGAELQARQQATLGETLSQQTGMASTYFGPGASRPLIRGMGGDRVKLLENGTGTLDASTTSPDHAVSIEPFLVKRIEVVRGPASLLYGNSAVGGIVNTLTHRIEEERPEKALSGEMLLRYGSASNEVTRGAIADYELLKGQSGSLVLHLDGFRRDADDLRIPGHAESEEAHAAEEASEGAGEEEISGRIPGTSLRADGGAMGLSYVGQGFHLGASYSGYNTNYGVPGHAHHHEEEAAAGEEGHEEEGGVRIDLKQRRVDVQGALQRDWGLFTGAKFKFGHADYTHQEIEASGEVGTRFDTTGHDARLETSHGGFDGQLNGALGLQVGRSKLEAQGEEAFIPPSLTKSTALFLYEEYKAGRLIVQTGARWERQDLEVDSLQTKRDDDLLGASIGLVTRIDTAHSAALTVSRTNRAPNAQELFANGPHAGTQSYEIGDATLSSEGVTHAELGLRRTKGFVTGEFSLFADRFSGYIHDEPTGELAVERNGAFVVLQQQELEPGEEGMPVYRYKQAKAEFKGVEADTLWHLHEGEGHSLDLRLAADAVLADSEGQDLPRIPPFRTTVGLEWRQGPWTLGADWQHGFRQDRVAEYEKESKAYDLVGAQLLRCFQLRGLSLDAYLRASNLLNKEIRPHSSYLRELAPLPARAVSAGVVLHFESDLKDRAGGRGTSGRPAPCHLRGKNRAATTWGGRALALPKRTPRWKAWGMFHPGLLSVLLLCLFSCLRAAPLVTAASPDTDLATIEKRLVQELIQGPLRHEEAPRLLASQREDGSWADVDYADKSSTEWAPLQHLDRLLVLALAFTREQSPDKGAPQLLQGVEKGLRAWYARRPVSENWWQNEIGQPQRLGPLLLLLKGRLPAELVAPGLALLPDPTTCKPWARTGQNLVWICGSTIYRGCLTETPADLATGFSAIRDETRIGEGEGIQPDFSFHQHGAQLYSGGYGLSFLFFVPRWAVLAEGTRFGFGEEAKSRLVAYLLDGTRWMIRGHNLDASVRGREIVRPAGAEIAKDLIPVARQLAGIHAPRARELEDFARHLEGRAGAAPVLGNRYFWRSEFMVQQRPDYYFSLRMVSKRLIGTEMINRENLRGYWLPFGVTQVQHSGAEYSRLYPLWDWARLPGVTCPDTVPEAPRYQTHDADFVGGVSDGRLGAAVMTLDKDGLKGRKAWFLFERVVVALGNGIQSPDTTALHTGVNQCWLAGPVSADGAALPFPGAASVTRWVHHDGVGYVFEPGQSPRLKLAEHTGSWHEINEVLPATPLQGRVFTLGLEHGAAKNGSYAYFLLPSASLEQTKAFADRPEVEILANTDTLQAVRERGTGLCQVVFHAAAVCELGNGVRLESDTPCLVLLNPGTRNPQATVAVPSGLATSLKLSLHQQGSTLVKQLSLPQGALAGSSVTLTLE